MKVRTLFTRLFIVLASSIRWQILVAILLYCGALIYSLYNQYLHCNEVDIKFTTSTLGSIGSVLSLATSVSFAFVVFIVNQTNSRKHDLFYKFKSILFDFDRFLKDYDSCDLVTKSQELSWKLKFVKFDEFPLPNWDDRIADVISSLDEELDYDDDPNLQKKVCGYLAYIEEIINEISLICIRQVIAGIFFRTVIKAFVLIGFLILVLVLSYLNLGKIPNLAFSVTPVFFGTCACLIFSELGLYLYRESNEMISFTSDDDNQMDKQTEFETTNELT